MIYVLLDTNIIIDIVVDRRDNVISGNLLKTFIKLLNYGEVKLIIPNVVKIETYRHLDTELELVGEKIDNTMKAIKELYGISTFDMDPLDLTQYKKGAKVELNKAKNQFQQHKVDYQRDIENTIELLFNHRNTIVIDDEGLMPKVFRRRVYKRAPFHRESKESYGDGTITETLINIQSFIDINPEDRIFFVTGNYKDFSDTKSDKLHPHIMQDMHTTGLDTQVVYVRSFNNLIYPYLKSNVENANLIEEFESEMDAEVKAYEERLYQDLEDIQRESAGLTALGEFASRIEENLPESNFATDVLEQFERLNKAYGVLEELSAFYEDDLDVDGLECSEMIERLYNIVGCGKNRTVENIKAILKWIEDKKRKCEIIDGYLPDFITTGEDVEFWDVCRKRYVFNINNLDYLTPENGGSDTVDVRITATSGQILAKGTINITYGFIEEDPFDGVGDGCKESIEYNTDEIVEKLKNIANEWESFIDENKKTAEAIRAALNI